MTGSTTNGDDVADAEATSGLSREFTVAPRLLRVLAYLMAVLLFVLMILTTVDVIGRYLFNNPVPGTVEYTELGIGYLVFGSLPLITARQEHITIDILDFIFRARRKLMQQVGVNVLGFVITGFIAWRLFAKAQELAANGDLSINMQLPLAPVAYFMSVMAAVSAVIMFMLTIHYVRLLSRGAGRR